MATPSDPSNQEAVVRRRNNGPPIKFLLPLIYAPVLPLIRLSLRHKPVLRDRLFTAVLAGAFAHGFYLVYPFLVAFAFITFTFTRSLVISVSLNHLILRHCMLENLNTIFVVWCVGLQNRVAYASIFR
ncbi:hypothetical protein GLYMA_05G010400v4 [Glycine max]|uniref:Uncharacterized protein n=1 Tax=Glycine soja TaxID=3848 RepID=A0A445KHM2_GLYSO|nr:hypothetical protein GLYMA_05G010400v4 [Glycine max]KAH1132241.1 hypothetical protein GYH30_011217 [Glycine max]RZC10401.1 hypothetical protein D0Y65_010935 [Glycine soja]